jgi:hypothetical protein
MGVNRWREKAGDRSLWAITLKQALVKLQGLYTNEEENASSCTLDSTEI